MSKEVESKPYHEHDCQNCIYLGSSTETENGHTSDYDYYFCHHKGEHPCLSSLIARYGENGDYSSGLSFVMSTIPLNKALQLAAEQNVLPDDVKEYIKKQQASWFKYCETDKDYADGNDKRWEGREKFILK